MLTCRHSDRDNSKMICGYPLPCPHHTVTVWRPLRAVACEPATAREIADYHARYGERR